MQLEIRVCACGCGRSFKAIPNSPSVYYSAYECEGRKPNQGRLEFTGITTLAVRQARRRERRAPK